MNKNANFEPNWVVLGQKILISTGEIKSFVREPFKNYLADFFRFLYGDRNFCQQVISPLYPGLQLSHLDQPQNFRFQAMSHFSGLTPVFGHSHFRGISTLHFGLFWTKLGGTVRIIKKNDPE